MWQASAASQGSFAPRRSRERDRAIGADPLECSDARNPLAPPASCGLAGRMVGCELRLVTRSIAG